MSSMTTTCARHSNASAPTGSGDGQLLVLGQLVHAKNGDDVGERLVVLQELLHGTGHVVVLVTDDVSGKHARGGVERVDSGVDTELGNLTGQHSGSVQVCEGGGWSRVGKVVSRHVDGLHGGNGTGFGRGNALLEGAKVSGQGRLVTDSGRDAAKQGRHLGTRLGESEDV